MRIPWSTFGGPPGGLPEHRPREVAPVPDDEDGNTGIMQRVALDHHRPDRATLLANSVDVFCMVPLYGPAKVGHGLVAMNSGWYQLARPYPGPPSYLTGNSFFGNLDLQSLFGFAGRFRTLISSISAKSRCSRWWRATFLQIVPG